MRDEVRDCDLCKNSALSPMSDVCRYCGIAMLNFEKRSLTNADRIRAMSDEELAEFIKADIINSLVRLHISWISDFEAAVKEELLARKRKEAQPHDEP